MASYGLPWQDNQADAVAYCEAGFNIFPLHLATTVPSIPNPHPPGSVESRRCRGECDQLGHGIYDARADSEWAKLHWAINPEHGIAARPAAGQIVLAIDARRDGNISLAKVEARYGKLPETFTVISGRGDGSQYRWFNLGQEPLSSMLCNGVGIISHGRGMAVMPPSLHPDTLQRYKFQKPIADIASGPNWLSEMVCTIESLTPGAVRHRSTPPWSQDGVHRRGNEG